MKSEHLSKLGKKLNALDFSDFGFIQQSLRAKNEEAKEPEIIKFTEKDFDLIEKKDKLDKKQK